MTTRYELIESIAEDILEETGFDAAGSIAVLDKTTYERTLPEGVSAEQAELVHQHDVDFLAASGLAIGTMANEAFGKAEEEGSEAPEEYELICDLGHARINSRVIKSHNIGGEITNNYLVSSYEVYSRGDEDVLAKVQQVVADLASIEEAEVVLEA